VAHHPGGGRRLRPRSKTPSWAGPARNLVRVCAPARAGAAPALLPGRGRPGGGSGLPCDSRVRQSWPPGRLLRRERLQEFAAALGAAAARTQSSPSATAGVLAVKRGGVPAQAVWCMTPRLPEHGVHRTPGGESPWAIACASGKARSGRPSTVLADISGLVRCRPRRWGPFRRPLSAGFGLDRARYGLEARRPCGRALR